MRPIYIRVCNYILLKCSSPKCQHLTLKYHIYFALYTMFTWLKATTTMSSTAQFKLARTHVQQGHNTTRFSFHMRASLRVHARLVTSNLPCKALVYTLDVCTMHVCMSGMHTPNLDCTCMQNCKPRTVE